MRHSLVEDSGVHSLFSLTSFIRIVGLAVLLGGAVIAFQVVQAAWELFENQSRVVLLSQQVEEATNINRIANEFVDIAKLIKFVNPSALQNASEDIPADISGSSQIANSKSSPPDTNQDLRLNLTYFVAWIIVFLLLGLIARVAYWFISAGGRVALYGSDQGHQLTKALKHVLLEKN